MRGRDDLYHLIQGMTKTEKRYFVLDAKKSGRADSRYLSLFEALNDREQTAAWQEAGSFFEAATRFYQIIFAAAGHSVAWDIVQRLNGRISRLRAMTLADPDRSTPGPVRMRRIYEAVRAGDGPAAQAAVRAHLEEVTQIAHRVLHPHGSLRA